MKDRYERNMIIRDYLIKIILVILAAFLVAWLVPKFIPKNNAPSVDLSPLTNQIFSDNLEKMKNAGITYFTTERLPKNVGDSKTLTLQEMYDLKLLTTLTDKNGDKCDVKKSYVKLTNQDKEYLMKVNLKCGDEEDYILVHLGCYSYCKDGLCEKKDISISKSSTATKQSTITTNTIIKKPTPSNPKDPENPKDPDKPVDPVKPKQYLYQYVKTTNAQISNWGNWSNWTEYLDRDNISEITCDEKDFTCLKEVKTKKEFEKVGTYKHVYRKERVVSKQLSSYQESYCKTYNYVVHETTVYQTTGSGYSDVNSGSWVKSGSPVAYTNPPADTANTRYVLTGAKYDQCNETCVTTPQFYYQKYVYKYSLSKVGTYNKTTTTADVTVSCAEKVTKTIPVYANVTVYDEETRVEPLYAYIKYYSTRTRTLIKEAETSYKWSKFNDKELLDAGYHYTGKRKEK